MLMFLVVDAVLSLFCVFSIEKQDRVNGQKMMIILVGVMMGVFLLVVSIQPKFPNPACVFACVLCVLCV
jgi:hypothetical protein